ncbi:MAG TPA: NAD(P)/FAD-dependent oxidoreductase [Streptosporangiaceae bacterium]|nr:NAD(P)/FAD-dependent oxidoreductase [Streptosporangiaceae bacterium]
MANNLSPKYASPPVIAAIQRHGRVLVIGAGSSGLAAAAELQRRGVRAEILERSDTVGSAWQTRYDRLRFNTCRWNSTLSHEPFPKGTPLFLLPDDFTRYLGSYAETNRLSVEFGVEVKRVERYNGEWQLITSAGERTADHVIIATGLMHTPRYPDWPGLDLYSGCLLHSADYRNAEPFRNADVLVVGAGSSAMDIAADLARGQAGRIRLAVRSQPNLMQRAPFGLPGDLLTTALFRLQPQHADTIHRILRRITIGNLAERGLTVPAEGSFTRARRTGSGPTVVDKAVLQTIKSRRVEIVAAVSSVHADGVRLADDSTVSPDVIIAATGFTPGLTEVVGHLGVLDDRGVPLVSGGPPALPGLRFSGFVANIRSQYKDALRVAEQVTQELG